MAANQARNHYVHYLDVTEHQMGTERANDAKAGL